MVPEAPMEKSPAGMVAAGPGWFTVNVRDAAWERNEYMGDACVIEGDGGRFDQIGYTIAVLQPGQPNGMYHRESNQEDFLVLAGECILLIEGEERRLQAWDFVHCPPGTDHIFVGAGAGPCVIFMAGARTNARATVYGRSELALRRGAGVERETSESHEAYAPFPDWREGPPTTWDGLPWDLR
jgi:uncharacterized cupin superfamily protein